MKIANRKWLGLACVTVAVAAGLKAQGCYEFDAAGIALQINVNTINLQLGPTDGATTYAFSGTNTFSQGGATQTSSESFTGNANIQYVNAGSAGSTGFQMVVPNADSNTQQGDHFWSVVLSGVADLIPGQLLPAPSALPPLSAWTGVMNSNMISVTHGGAPINYPLTAVGACGSTSGGGATGGGSTSATSPLQALGDPASLPGGCNCGEPVNLATGDVYYEVTDYKTAGANPLQFTRYYNSLGAASGNTYAAMLGPNWRTNYDRFLRFVSSTSVIAERANGQQVTFTLNESTWTTDSDIDLALTNSGTGSGSTWTLTDHWDNVETYANSGGAEGLLQTIQARNGYTQTLKYIGNQLSVVTDSYNRSLVLLVNNGLLESVDTADATLLTYGFTSGTLTSIGYQTTPTAGQKYVYGNSSFPTGLTGIIDEDGATYISWTYDSMGRALTGQFAGGAGLTTFAYNSDGSRTVTNALGETEIYKFTTLQNVSKVIEVDRQASATTAAATSTYTYDSDGYTASYTDWNGNLRTYANDAHGQPTTINEAVGTPQARTTTVTYLSNFHLPSQIVTPGLTAAFTYDSTGELLTKTVTDTTATSVPYSTNGQTRTWTYTYSNSLLASVKTPRTDVSGMTKLAYDATGALVSATNALNQTTQVTQHLPGGLPETIVDANGVTTNLTYDARQRLLSSAISTLAEVLTSKYVYDAAGNLLSVTEPDGSAITATYDQAHRMTGIADLFQQRIAFTLDALGDQTKTTWLNSIGGTQRTRSGVYDELGRLLQDAGGAGQTTSYTYDANGNPLTVTDPLSHTTQRTFDPLNRLTTSIDPASGKTTAAYDPHNRPLTVTDPLGGATSYTYDGFGDLVQISSPATGTTVYHYDADANLTQKVDARGAAVNYTFDALDRTVSATYPGDSAENVMYTYDQTGYGFGVGRLTSLSDAAGTLSRSYDERGNVLREARVHGSVSLTSAYTYDAAALVASIAYPSGDTVTYARDSMGRITAATLQAKGGASQTVVSAVTYEPFGPVGGLTFGNGIIETRSFDPDYRITKLTSTGANSVQSLTYGYDASNNVLSIVDGVTSGNGQKLAYDVLNRLTSATGGFGSLGYSYDGNGNRLSESNPASTLDGLAATGFSYNQAGRLASTVTGNQQLTQYTYDAFGHRLIKLGTVTPITMYQYDQSGDLLEETDGQGNALTDYINIDGRPVATVALSTGGQVYFLHDDRLGTPQMATNSSQATVWLANYLPFGGLNSGTSQTATVSQDLRLPGQENDAETGLYHNGFRDYAAGWGRYSQSDPLGLGGGLNTYAYVGGNPLRYADPWGLCSVTDAANAIRSWLQQQANDLESDVQPTWATFEAAFPNYPIYALEQLPGVAAVVNAYRQYAAPYVQTYLAPVVPVLYSIYSGLQDLAAAAEGEFGGLLGTVQTIFGIVVPQPTYSNINFAKGTVTITPPKQP